MAAQTMAGVPTAGGDNSHGQAGGHASTINLTPGYMAGLDDGIDGNWAASAGGGHNCALGFREQGVAGTQNSLVVRCWGGNSMGQLGDGTTSNSDAGAVVASAAIGDVVDAPAVSAGGSHSCGFSQRSGVAYCWGANGSGQLGDGTTTHRWIPVAVAGSLDFAPGGANGQLTWPFASRTLTAGADHTCAVTAAGAAYCWGAKASGQLGNGTTTGSNVPVPVAGGLMFAMLCAGDRYTCGITTAGAGYCWGVNAGGQLGNGTITSSAVPAAIAGDMAFAMIGAGASHACGVSTDGAAHCWGSNANGQLGDGSTRLDDQPPDNDGRHRRAQLHRGERRRQPQLWLNQASNRLLLG
jgi:alpha-tubulin suppressor-like RCC1 family protein